MIEEAGENDEMAGAQRKNSSTAAVAVVVAVLCISLLSPLIVASVGS